MTFLDTGPVPGDAPPWNVASITVMIRKARGGYPGLSPFVSSAIELPDGAGASNNPARPVRLASRTMASREASPTGSAVSVSDAVTPDAALNDWDATSATPAAPDKPDA